MTRWTVTGKVDFDEWRASLSPGDWNEIVVQTKSFLIGNKRFYKDAKAWSEWSAIASKIVGYCLVYSRTPDIAITVEREFDDLDEAVLFKMLHGGELRENVE